MKNERVEIIESINRIESFAPGYPKRITVSPRSKHMQEFFDWQYETICELHGITPEPKIMSLFDVPISYASDT